MGLSSILGLVSFVPRDGLAYSIFELRHDKSMSPTHDGH